jgi:hypothetical protein
MNFDSLRYFKLAYKSQNFAAAAQKIPISTQGLTQAIGRIEKELGVDLFVLNENGVKVPTVYADVLLRFTDSLEEDFPGFTVRSIRYVPTKTIGSGLRLLRAFWGGWVMVFLMIS